MNTPDEMIHPPSAGLSTGSITTTTSNSPFTIEPFIAQAESATAVSASPAFAPKVPLPMSAASVSAIAGSGHAVKSPLPFFPSQTAHTEDSAIPLQIGLQIIRSELHFSQKSIAEIIGVSQPAIAQIEQRGNDIKLATLKRYVEAMGGRLTLSIDLPTGNSRTFLV